jgi:hypothetical protein
MQYSGQKVIFNEFVYPPNTKDKKKRNVSN